MRQGGSRCDNAAPPCVHRRDGLRSSPSRGDHLALVRDRRRARASRQALTSRLHAGGSAGPCYRCRNARLRHRLPGSNADAEMVHTLRDVCGGRPTCLAHRDGASLGHGPRRHPRRLQYGDYLRTGAIAKTSRSSAIRAHAARGGYVLGVCNGFQILTEARMLPGASPELAAALRVGDWFVRSRRGAVHPRPRRRLEAAIRARRGPLPGDAETLRRLEGKGDRSSLRTRPALEKGNPTQHGPIAGIYGGPARRLRLIPTRAHERSAHRRPPTARTFRPSSQPS